MNVFRLSHILSHPNSLRWPILSCLLGNPSDTSGGSRARAGIFRVWARVGLEKVGFGLKSGSGQEATAF